MTSDACAIQLDACEQSQIQADLLAIMDKSALIERPSTTPDTIGTATKSYSTVATSPCLVGQPSAGQLQEYASKLGSQAAWQIKFPAGTDVRVQDQLTIDGQLMIVQADLSPNSYEFTKRVLASEVR